MSVRTGAIVVVGASAITAALLLLPALPAARPSPSAAAEPERHAIEGVAKPGSAMPPEICHVERPAPGWDELDTVGRGAMLDHVRTWLRDLGCPTRTEPLLFVLDGLRVVDGILVVESDEVVTSALDEMTVAAPDCAEAMRSEPIVDPLIARLSCPIRRIRQGVGWRTYAGLWLARRRSLALDLSGPWTGAAVGYGGDLNWALEILADVQDYAGFTPTDLTAHRRMVRRWQDEWVDDRDIVESPPLREPCAEGAGVIERGDPTTDLERHLVLLLDLRDAVRHERFSDEVEPRRGVQRARFPCDSACRAEWLAFADEIDAEVQRVCRLGDPARVTRGAGPAP